MAGWLLGSGSCEGVSRSAERKKFRDLETRPCSNSHLGASTILTTFAVLPHDLRL